MEFVRITALLLSLCALASVAVSGALAEGAIQPSVDAPPPHAAPSNANRDIAAIPPSLAELSEDRGTLRKMIGQMIIIGFPGTFPREDWPSQVVRMIHEGEIGGVVLFGDNISNPAQIKALTGALQEASSDLPPLISVDQEGGQIQRLTRQHGFVGLPSAQRVATMDQETAYQLYRRSARELADLGFNVNLGPVVDLNINPNSPAIGRKGRSYASDPKAVVSYALQFVDAHDQAGVLTVAKHFPGHGSAREDPHREPVDISTTWTAAELDPFRALIDDHFIDMVMVGHLYHPLFSDGLLPASLSKRAITDVLRQQLGFRGLVITDDLEMGAVSDRYGVESAAVLAVAAGADLLIVANRLHPDPAIADQIIAAISDAVDQGVITRQAIEDSHRRIVLAKTWLSDRRAYARGLESDAASLPR